MESRLVAELAVSMAVAGDEGASYRLDFRTNWSRDPGFILNFAKY